MTSFLDKLIENGSNLFNKVLDKEIAEEETKQQKAILDAENSRLSQLEFLNYAQNNQTILGTEVPNWAIWAGVGLFGILAFKKIMK